MEEVPPMYDALGRQNGKEPLICWLWGLKQILFKMMKMFQTILEPIIQ